MCGCSTYEGGNHNHNNIGLGNHHVETKERRQMMILNEQNLREHQRQLDVIGSIPSDLENLNNYSNADMEEFNIKHLRDLREQVRGYDESELIAVAEEIARINFTILHNALGEYCMGMYKTLNSTKNIINEE